jgi:hypothetical protein
MSEESRLTIVPTSKKSTEKKQQNFLAISTLILLAFASAFYPRIIEAIGFPSLINFLHFISVPFTLFIALTHTKVKIAKHIIIARQLAVGLFVFLLSVVTSGLVNEAGVINVIVDYILLAEPFMLLLAIVSIPMSVAKIKLFQRFLFISASINLVLALIQKPLIDLGHIYAEGFDGTDGAQGVFFVSGAGNYVSTSVSIKFALYYLFFYKRVPFWFRLAWLGTAFVQLIISDSKQILICSGLAFIILTFINFNDLRKTLGYLFGLIILFAIFAWCVENVEAFVAFQNGMEKFSEWGPDGAARQIKTAPFKIATSYYESILNWLFGLGPGHTFGRLAAWFLKDYSNIFVPLHATSHTATNDAWNAYYQNWIALESTLYHPFFGWAGIWGDLGLVGLGSYLYLAFIVWHNICCNELSKFFMLVVFAVGLIFTQMEEPGYMLFTAMLIGLQWQQNNIRHLQNRNVE